MPEHRPAALPDIRTGLLVVVAVILVVWALRATMVVTLPVTAAVLVALAVMPVRDRVRRAVPDKLGWLGTAAAMGVILLILGLFFAGLWFAAQQIVGEFPEPAQMSEMLDAVGGGQAASGQPTAAEGAAAGASAGVGAGPGGAGGQAAPPDSAREAATSLGDRALGAAAGAAVAVLNSAIAVLSGLVVVFFLTLLILSESGDWRRKLEAVASRRTEWRLTESADVIAGKVRSYLLIQAGIGAISAALYAVWLSVWGVSLVFVWTFLIFLANFVPTLGSLVGGTLIVAYVLISEGLGTAVAVGLGILAIEQVMGNLVGPRLEGRTVSLSPLVVLVALLAWGWIWGIAGALLAVPMTVALVVLGAHVPATRPWALMLSNQTDERGLEQVTRPERS